ncbi:FMN-binding negative transcriptional regulator [Zobellella iuensis]|uniref:FMN-binding negative transcriptional regulator n=1 Tax=Zobellella iuensis TaxID=2803811 RepID=A0ABS1QPC2_9GAMM|nr:FMN-binding negative transcriptional regulator [Zobellella iuensis]MBL1376367.1 FMN-binding negative transcriptional regulator [Zobellella iuensis]
MYLPVHFNESRTQILHECIEKHPFGTLITHGKHGLDANHLPFELVASEGEQGVLKAHIARANPIWQDVENGDQVLVAFRAGDAYISPNWYPTKHESHRQVPTWNYRVVHAHGRIHFLDDEKYVRGVVARLTRTHEASQPSPWKMADAPRDYIDALLEQIIGLRIDIIRLVGKHKLGQDEVEQDRLGAGQALSACGNHVIGEAMLAQVPGTKNE